VTVFFRVLEHSADEKAERLLHAIAVQRDFEMGGDPSHNSIFETDSTKFSAIPGSPFAYWVSDSLREAFLRYEPFEQPNRRALVGVATGDDARYLRCRWEVAVGLQSRWRLLAKGGAHSRHYADVHMCIDWLDDGTPIELSFVGGRVRKPDFFRPGLTWPSRTNGLSFRVLPRGCVFGHKGPTAFIDEDDSEKLLALCALVNSSCFGYFVSTQLARTELAQSYEVGLIQQTPVPTLSDADTTTLARLARRAWSLKRSLDMSNEASHAFVLPPAMNDKGTGLNRRAVEQELEEIQRRIDEVAFTLYQTGPQDRAAIERASMGVFSGDSREADDVDDDSAEPSESGRSFGAGEHALHSWLIGVAFGRFDPRLATGERKVPPEPDPFEPLPRRSPGMYPEGEEPADCPDILVDDEGQTDDIVARARAVAEHVRFDVPANLRGWFAREFLPLHIRMYSKSRRKAPIYWQLATPSASYSVWLYIHAFSKDTLFRVQNDYVAPKLAHEERRLQSLASEMRDKATAAERKELAAQESFVEELRALLDEVKRIAPLWNPNLDDGVIINFAPLWRLVPQNKSWQKELKSTWDALCEGNYDWAHLALHLWPERVVPKCAIDRSLAIAHGLEDVFWVEGADGKWTARKTPTRSVDELVRESTSPAVKSALKSLLEAPAATGKSAARARGGRREAAAAAERGNA
jgi:hypothetical protein